MKAFVIFDPVTKTYYKKNRSGGYAKWVSDIKKARIYLRRCDASNSWHEMPKSVKPKKAEILEHQLMPDHFICTGELR